MVNAYKWVCDQHQLHGSQQASMIDSVAATWSDYATCAPNKMIGDGILNTYVALLQVRSWYALVDTVYWFGMQLC